MDSSEYPGASPELTQKTRPMTSAELGRLFYREIALEHIYALGQNYEGEPIANGVVEGAAKIRIEDSPLYLSGHQLFIFNALLRLRNNPDGIAYSDVADLGLSPGSSHNARSSFWISNLRYLTTKINTAADAEILGSTGSGRWRRHHVNPGFEVVRSDTYETKPEGFYEFSQEINGPLLRHTHPRTVDITNEDPIKAVIRDDDVIVVNGTATTLNNHDRALLQLVTFNNGEPLSLDQIAALGFHAYAPPGQGRGSALYRSIQRLNQAFDVGDERPLFFLDTGVHASYIRALRSYALADTRRLELSVHAFNSVAPAFEKLLEEAPMSEDPLGLPLKEIKKKFKTYGAHSLTLPQAYALSLRLGTPLPELSGTSYETKVGKHVQYDMLAPHILEGTPMSRSQIGELMGGQRDGSIYAIERGGLNRLRNAGNEIELLRRAGGMAKAIADAEDMPPEERLESFLTGDAITIILSLENRPLAEREAVIAHFLPRKLRKAPRPGDLYNGLPWMRRIYKAAAPEILNAPNLELLPQIEERLKSAHLYFMRLIGSPSEGVRAQSFEDIASQDLHFAQDGKQLIADILAILIAQRIPTKSRRH